MFGQKKPICPFCFSDCEVSDVEHYCGKCHSFIPKEVLTSRLFPIAVVGSSAAGKTHFLTVLAHLLCEGVVWPSFWTVTRIIRHADDSISRSANDESDDEFVNCEEKLYPQQAASGMILKQTEPPSEAAPPLSLVIHISYEKGFANRMKEPYHKQDVLLAFTDTAGEDFLRTDMRWEDVGRKYPIIGRELAEGLIALLNPMQLSSVRNECQSANPALKKSYEQSGLSLSASVMLQKVLSKREIRNSMKMKPLAVCLSKTDALVAINKLDVQDYLAGTADIVCHAGKDEGCIQLQELQDLSTRTEAYLAEMDGDDGYQEGHPKDGGISAAARFFKYRSFFATDALGPAIQTARLVNSDDRMFSGMPVPRRVLDPLLWILWQHGLVGGC